jgi:hypothetical protein
MQSAPVQLTGTRGKNTCKQDSQARVRASSVGFRTLERLTDLHPPSVRALAKRSACGRTPLPCAFVATTPARLVGGQVLSPRRRVYVICMNTRDQLKESPSSCANASDLSGL